MWRKTFILLFGICLFNLQNDANAQFMLDSTYVDTSILLSGLDIPWEMKYAPDGYIYFTERFGRVSRVHPDSPGVQHVIADLTPQVLNIGAAGLLGLALHPDFLDTAHVFVIYTYDIDSMSLYMNERLVRYEFNGTSLVNPVILRDSIGASIFVAGSRMIIGPDRKIYITTGCTQDFPQAQNLQSNAGKVLRLNLDGSVPFDNPYPGNPVWTLGHRNPQGLDHHNGIWYCSEHGPHNDDEINVLEVGRNYGWPDVEGYCDLPTETQFCIDSNVMSPLFSYISTIGISEVMFYQGSTIPEFENSLLQLSLKNQRIYQVKLDTSGTTALYQKEYLHYEFGRLRDILQLPDERLVLAAQIPQNGAFAHNLIILEPAGVPTCAAPTNMDTIINGNTVTFSWDAVAGATQYEIRAKQLPVGEFDYFNVGNQTSVSFPGVPAGIYGWQVVADCGLERSPAPVMNSFVVGMVDPPTECPIPDPPFTNNIQKTSAQLNWDPVESAQNHVLRGGLSGSDMKDWVYLSTNSTSNSFIVSGLVAGISYEWQVRAVCDTLSGDSSGWSQIGAFTTLLCERPGPIASTVNSSTSVTLNWTSVSNAVRYVIWGKEVSSSSIASLGIFAPSTSLTINTLIPNGTYVWTIFAECDANGQLVSNFVIPIDTFSTPPAASEKFDEANFRGLSIMPNPNNGQFVVSVNTAASKDAKLFVYNELGQIVYEIDEEVSGNFMRTLDVNHLPQGVYLLELHSGKSVIREKIVIN